MTFLSATASAPHSGRTFVSVPRPLRPKIAGAAYHVTTRGTARHAIFRDDDDRRRFLAILGAVVARHAWRCDAYCLMTTHYHVLVTTPAGDLSSGMQLLNGSYAQSFNRRHRRDGHLYRGRFGSVLVEGETHALEAFRYIALNPVRAGACRRPEEWPWSSYRATLGLAPRPTFLALGWVLEHFAEQEQVARSRLRSFVDDS